MYNYQDENEVHITLDITCTLLFQMVLQPILHSCLIK